jgi:acyl dehydratase
MTVVVELPVMPTIGALYRRAALGTLRRGRGSELPPGGLAVRNIQVNIAHLSAYARVCGFRLSDTLPATYPHVLVFPLAMRLMSAPDFPFPLVGLIHVANEITVTRPISTTDLLDFQIEASDLRPHDRGRQFDVVATASVGGIEVWRDVSTYLHKETAPPSRPGSAPDAGNPTDTADTGGVVWRVGREVGRDYAAASGDRNPIHTSRVGARLFGFRGPIAHGMWTKARALAALEGRLPDAYQVAVTFKRPIPLPSTVTFTTTPTPTPKGKTLTVQSGKGLHLIGSVDW